MADLQTTNWPNWCLTKSYNELNAMVGQDFPSTGPALLGINISWADILTAAREREVRNG